MDSGTVTAVYSQATSAYMVGLAAFLRVQPRIWRFEPFLEGIAGVKWFETVSRGETYSPLFGEVSSSTASFSEAVSVLGYGAGINFRWTPLDNEEYGVGQVHVGYRYSAGPDADDDGDLDATFLAPSRAARFEAPRERHIFEQADRVHRLAIGNALRIAHLTDLDALRQRQAVCVVGTRGSI
jgi:hypothetical protein